MPFFHDDINDNTEFRKKQDKLKHELSNFKNKNHNSKQGINSVLTPPAQFAEPCELRSLAAAAKCLNDMLSIENKEYPAIVKALTELHFLYGLRISEVLQVQHQQIMNDGSILIKGLKGSSDRLVYPVNYRDVWLRLKSQNASIPSYLNRYYFYRIYKKKGIYATLQANKKASVTHIIRYIYINRLINNNASIDQIQQLIGHKTIKSTLHYANRIKR